MAVNSMTTQDVSLGAVMRAMSALLLGVAILNVGSGALMAVIGLRLSAEGTSSLLIGVIMSAYHPKTVIVLVRPLSPRLAINGPECVCEKSPFYRNRL